MRFEEDIKRIEDYLAGRGTEGERQAFERRLASEEDLRQWMEDLQLLGRVTREKAIKDRLSDFKQWESEENRQRPVFRLRPWMAAAASVVILVGAFFGWQEYQEAQRIDKLLAAFEHYPSQVLTRGPSEQRQRENAYVLYESRRYKEAVPYFEAILDLGLREDSLYYAISLLRAKEFDEAQVVLESLSDKEEDREVREACVTILIEIKE